MAKLLLDADVDINAGRSPGGQTPFSFPNFGATLANNSLRRLELRTIETP
jgi:hypothetical protein